MWRKKVFQRGAEAAANGQDNITDSATEDPVGVGDDPAVGRLPEDLGQAHHRHDSALDQVPQHHARPHRRQLVNVAHQQQAGLGRQGAEQVAMSGTSTIEVSSTTSRSQSKGWPRCA